MVRISLVPGLRRPGAGEGAQLLTHLESTMFAGQSNPLRPIARPSSADPVFRIESLTKEGLQNLSVTLAKFSAIISVEWSTREERRVEALIELELRRSS